MQATFGWLFFSLFTLHFSLFFAAEANFSLFTLLFSLFFRIFAT